MSNRLRKTYVVTTYGQDTVLSSFIVNLIATYTKDNFEYVAGYVAMQWLKKDMRENPTASKRDYASLEELLADLKTLADTTNEDFVPEDEYYLDILDSITAFVIYSYVAKGDIDDVTKDKLITIRQPITGEVTKLSNRLSLIIGFSQRVPFYELLQGKI